MLALLYKTSKPLWNGAKAKDDYLAFYLSAWSDEKVQALLHKCNTEHTTGMPEQDRLLQWDKIEYFYVSEQDIIDTMGD